MELTGAITMDPTEAQAQLDELHAHRAHLSDEERQMLAGYRALSRGRTIIDLRQAIAGGGTFDDGTPRLAVALAPLRWVYLWRYLSGSLGFGSNNTVLDWGSHTKGWSLRLPETTLPRHGAQSVFGTRRAIVPAPPVSTRFRLGKARAGGWRSCLTLFEVGEWAQVPLPPGDPALLRHLAGWMFTVEATWDLTDLERAVLGGRNE